nr:beta-ketoacyl-ACP synthase II [uncultured Flavonifractor sp.]
MKKRRVVITGMGTVNPLGHTVAQSWQAVRDGVCGIAPITQYDASRQKVHLAAEVKDWEPTSVLDKKEVRHMARYAQFAMASAKEAMADSGLDPAQMDRTRCGVIVSSGIGGIAMAESEQMRCSEKGFDRASPFYIPSAIANMGAGLIAIAFGFQGMCTCPVTACAGGSNAVGDAFRHIRDGYAEVMLCGGAESVVTPLSMGGFTSMRALHVGDDPARASIPFDAERSGFVMGEGAGILVLEEYEHAMARGARVYAEVVGYGATCDAYHMTAPAPNGEGGARAMAQALADGGVSPEQVGYINAHGTSTPLNDSGETAAIKTVFGEHARKLAVSSTKSMTGHMLGAAGGVEAIFTALALKEGYLPATIHYQVPDPACDLDYVPNQGRPAQAEYALSNSLGFGGHNACVLFKKWEG